MSDISNFRKYKYTNEDVIWFMNDLYQEYFSDTQENSEITINKFKKLLDKYNISAKTNMSHTENAANAITALKKDTIDLSKIISEIHNINDHDKIKNLLSDILNDTSA